MDAKLQEKCDLLAGNHRIVQNSAKLDFQVAAGLGALIITGANKVADESAIRKNRALLKSKVSAFNNLRGNATVALLCKMCLAEDAEAYLDKVMSAYDLLKQGHVFHSEYEALTASSIADFAEPAQYGEIAQQTQEVLQKMSDLHPLLTSRQDTAVAALLAMSGLDVDATLAEAEECYETLKGDHFKLAKDSLQSVSMILALSNMPVAEKCARFRVIRQAVNAKGDHMFADQLPILAALVDLDMDPAQIGASVEEASQYLKGKKGFGGIFGMGTQMRMVLAAAMVLQVANEEAGRTGDAAAGGHAVATMITQEIVMAIIMTIIMIAVFISNSSHSSGN